MRTVIRLDVTEEQRSAIHQLVTGKVTKQLAGRAMVSDFIAGTVAGASYATAKAEPLSLPSGEDFDHTDTFFGLGPVTHAERDIIDELHVAGHDHGYIVGWIKGGRRQSK